MPTPYAHPAPHGRRVARALGASGQQPLVLGGVLRERGQLLVPYGFEEFGDGRGARHGLPGRQDVPGREDVAQPQLGRVDAEFLRELVHLRLVRGAHLHRALAAHVPGRRVVRAHDPALDEGVRDDVRAAGEGDGGGQRLARTAGVRARVHEDLRLDLDEAALGVGVVAVAEQGRVAVGVAEEGVLARRGELDGALGAHREQPEGQREALVLAVARRAGDAGHDDLDLVRAEPVARGGEVAVAVRVGRGRVQLDAPVRAWDGEPRLGADRGRVLTADAVEPVHDDLADRLGVARAQRDVPHEVPVRVQRGRLEGLLGIGDGVERLVRDLDGGGGHAGRVGVVGRDGGDRLAVVADDLGGEDGPLAAEGVRGQVLVCEHRAHAPHPQRLARVDRDDPRVRVRGAQDRRPQQALGPQVRRVREGALGLGAQLRGRQRGAEAEGGPLLGLFVPQVLQGLQGRLAHAWAPSWGWAPGAPWA